MGPDYHIMLLLKNENVIHKIGANKINMFGIQNEMEGVKKDTKIYILCTSVLCIKSNLRIF